MEALRRTERELLLGLEKAIAAYVNPSLQEIAQSAGPYWYPSSVRRYLGLLAKKGYVQLAPANRARGVRLLHPASAAPEGDAPRKRCRTASEEYRAMLRIEEEALP